VAGYHCIHPEFLQGQLEKSLSNIGLEALDLYYLNNVSESQMLLVGRERFMERLLVKENSHQAKNSIFSNRKHLNFVKRKFKKEKSSHTDWQPGLVLDQI